MKNFEKMAEITKLRIFHSFPTAYHLHQSDKWFENGDKIQYDHENSVIIFKIP